MGLGRKTKRARSISQKRLQESKLNELLSMVTFVVRMSYLDYLFKLFTNSVPTCSVFDNTSNADQATTAPPGSLSPCNEIGPVVFKKNCNRHTYLHTQTK